MSGRLEAKTVIITGGGSTEGMGFATAKLFAAEGASVLITDVDGEAVKACAAAITAEGGVAIGYCHDVSDESSWAEVVQLALTRWDRIDILVNNAGIYRAQAIDDTGLDTFEALVSVNLRGTFLGCRSVVPHMRERGGSIVNVSSVAGLVGVHMSSVYAATKGAVRSFSKSLALDEARHGIRCNSVHPGTIDTEMVRKLVRQAPEMDEAIKASIPLGRAGTPTEVARMSLFLASDEASYITGAEFVVDGGLTAQ